MASPWKCIGKFKLSQLMKTLVFYKLHNGLTHMLYERKLLEILRLHRNVNIFVFGFSANINHVACHTTCKLILSTLETLLITFEGLKQRLDITMFTKW